MGAEQVHCAVGHDGRPLAVKVQHARLRDSCAADILMVETVVRAAHLLFPDFNYQWLVDEMKHNLPRVRLCAGHVLALRAGSASTWSTSWSLFIHTPGLGRQELDFEVEAANAERCRRNLASPRSAVRSTGCCSCGNTHTLAWRTGKGLLPVSRCAAGSRPRARARHPAALHDQARADNGADRACLRRVRRGRDAAHGRPPR